MSGGKVGILVLDFHFPTAVVAGAAGMWKSRHRFPRARGQRRKTCFWFSALSTARHFRRPFLSCNAPLREAGKQLPLGFAHLRGGPGIAVGARQLFHFLSRHIVFQTATDSGRLPQDFPRRGVPLVGANRLALTVFFSSGTAHGR